MASTLSLSPAVAPVSHTSNCNYCSFCSNDVLTYVKHLFQAHCSESNFHYVWGITDRPYAFKTGATYASFLTHYNHKHINWREILGRNLTLQSQIPHELDHGAGSEPSQPDTQEAMDLQHFDHSHSNDLCSGNELAVSSEEVELAAARYLKEKYRLT